MGQALFDGGDTEQQHQQHQQHQHQFSRRPSAFNKVAATATTANYNWFAVGVGFLVVGLTCSMLDLNRIWCNPQNHVVQGHAVWHLFTALALMCQFQHYTQFQSKSSSNAAAAALSVPLPFLCRLLPQNKTLPLGQSGLALVLYLLQKK